MRLAILTAVLAMAGGLAAAAQDTAQQPPMESKGVFETLKDAGVSVSGFINFGYNYNLNNPTPENDRSNAIHVFDNEHNEFRAVAELVLSKAVEEDGDVGGRIDLFFGNDAAILGGAFGTDDSVVVQQAFAEWMIPGGEGLKLKAGRFVTLLGAEVIESMDNWNISRSVMFGFAIPFAHTGALLSRPFGEQVSVTLGVVNGWDGWFDNNGGKSLLGSIAVTPDPKWSGSLNFVYGGESADGSADQSTGDKRLVVDLVLSTTMIEQWTFMLNVDFGSEDRASFAEPGEDADWFGIAGYVKYDYTKEWYFTARIEQFSDGDGARTMGILPVPVLPAGADDVDYMGFTFTAGYRPTDKLELRAEIRFDSASEDVLARKDSDDTDGESSQLVFGAEATWKF